MKKTLLFNQKDTRFYSTIIFYALYFLLVCKYKNMYKVIMKRMWTYGIRRLLRKKQHPKVVKATYIQLNKF